MRAKRATFSGIEARERRAIALALRRIVIQLRPACAPSRISISNSADRRGRHAPLVVVVGDVERVASPAQRSARSFVHALGAHDTRDHPARVVRQFWLPALGQVPSQTRRERAGSPRRTWALASRSRRRGERMWIPGERERSSLRAARALATWQFELSGSAERASAGWIWRSKLTQCPCATIPPRMSRPIARPARADPPRHLRRPGGDLFDHPGRHGDERLQESLSRGESLLGDGRARHPRRAALSAHDPGAHGAACRAAPRGGRRHLDAREPGRRPRRAAPASSACPAPRFALRFCRGSWC